MVSTQHKSLKTACIQVVLRLIPLHLKLSSHSCLVPGKSIGKLLHVLYKVYWSMYIGAYSRTQESQTGLEGQRDLLLIDFLDSDNATYGKHIGYNRLRNAEVN